MSACPVRGKPCLHPYQLEGDSANVTGMNAGDIASFSVEKVVGVCSQDGWVWYTTLDGSLHPGVFFHGEGIELDGCENRPWIASLCVHLTSRKEFRISRRMSVGNMECTKILRCRSIIFHSSLFGVSGT